MRSGSAKRWSVAAGLLLTACASHPIGSAYAARLEVLSQRAPELRRDVRKLEAETYHRVLASGNRYPRGTVRPCPVTGDVVTVRGSAVAVAMLAGNAVPEINTVMWASQATLLVVEVRAGHALCVIDGGDRDKVVVGTRVNGVGMERR